MEKLALDQVFRPFATPTTTYVRRNGLERSVDEALSETGAGLVIFGPSATGKTTLVKKSLTRAGITEYVNQLLPAELDEKKLYEQLIAKVRSLAGEAQRSGRRQAAQQTTFFDLLAKKPMPVLLDDARRGHVPILADLAKAFNEWSDDVAVPSLTLIIAGIDINLADFEKRRPDEEPRFIPVPVKRFLDAELEQLIQAGEAALHIQFSQELKAHVIALSAGMPLTCQSICRYVCEAAKIHETQDTLQKIEKDTFLPAVERYVGNKEMQIDPKIRRATSLASGSITAADVLRSLFEIQDANNDMMGRLHVSISQVVARLKRHHPNLTEADVKKLVDRMTLPEGGEVLTWAQTGDNFTFREPLYRFVYRAQRAGTVRYDASTLQWLVDAVGKAIA